jgi:hypothetical protein
MVLRDGESVMDLAAAVMPASTVAAINAMVATAGKGWFIPASPVRSDGVPSPLATPQPIKTFEACLTVRNPQAAALPHTYIYGTQTPDTWVNKPVLAASTARAREAGWDYHELPTGHAVYDTMPQELTALLASLA